MGFRKVTAPNLPRALEFDIEDFGLRFLFKMVRRGSHLSERSRNRALMLVPRLPRLSTGANYSPHATSRWKRCPRMCSAPPRTAERVAPPEGNRCGKSQLSGSEGAGRAADSDLRWHSLGGDTMRLREHLVQALSPPASPAAAQPRRPPQPFLPFWGFLDFLRGV